MPVGVACLLIGKDLKEGRRVRERRSPHEPRALRLSRQRRWLRPGAAMGKVNVAKLRYLSRDDFRVLTAVRHSPITPSRARPGSASCSRKFPGSGTCSGPWNAAEVGSGEEQTRKRNFSKAFIRKP